MFEWLKPVFRTIRDLQGLATQEVGEVEWCLRRKEKREDRSNSR